MATFTIAPAMTTQLTVRPNIRQVQFGDGYSQRLAFGLNVISEQWELTFHCKGTTERDAVLDFFVARNGQESFDWTTPNGDAKKFICQEWRQRQEGETFFVIDTTFMEVHEP